MKRFRIKWLIIAGLVAVLITALVLVAKPGTPVRVSISPSPVPSPTISTEQKPSPSTQPKITWSPTSVEVILSPGETATRNFTFTSDQNLQNVAISAVPAIAGFLNLQPSSLASVPANQPQSVGLNFVIPSGATLGTYNGTIQARVGNQTFPQTLKVVVNVWQKFHDPTSGFSFRYPPAWFTWPVSVPGGRLTVSNVMLDTQSTPESMLGVCKVTFNKFEKPSDITLREWLDADSGGLPPVSSTPISVNSLNGLREISGEIAATDTAYLLLPGNLVLSTELICGPDMQTVGEAVFQMILSTIMVP